METGANLQKVI